MATHAVVKPYKCEICLKTFAQKVQLNNHSVTHSNEKPFNSRLCQKRFTRIILLKIPEKTHSGETCDKLFEDMNIPVKTDWNENKRLEVFGIQMPSVTYSETSLVKVFGCALCNEMFQIEKEFVEHCFVTCYFPVEDDLAELF